MTATPYDLITEFYLNFVQKGLENQTSIFHLAMKAILDLIGEIQGKRVCDLACGEGYLSRALAAQGATVTGVDISRSLLGYARQRSSHLGINYLHDDAQSLVQLSDHTFDAVVCSLALMDIADIRLTFRAVHRILRTEGCFVFAILHPCFETPFSVPDSTIETDEQGNFAAVRVMRYLEEGYWNSGGDGMRGRVGAYHRTLSTYLNTLLDSNFLLVRVIEPVLPSTNTEDLSLQKDSKIPPILVVKALAG